MVAAIALIVGLVAVTAAWQVATWPDVAAVRDRNPATSAFMERARRTGPHDSLAWQWVPTSRISPHLKVAVLVAEDSEFFSHDGFSRHEAREALREAWRRKRLPRGASTITQQLAKNLWLGPARTPWRKLKEGALTRQLERELDKKRILEIYLNVVELGPGVYGAEAASKQYFGVSASALTERQAAELAASLTRPRSWHPGVTSPGYLRRVNLIQRRAAASRWLRNEL